MSGKAMTLEDALAVAMLACDRADSIGYEPEFQAAKATIRRWTPFVKEAQVLCAWHEGGADHPTPKYWRVGQPPHWALLEVYRAATREGE